METPELVAYVDDFMCRAIASSLHIRKSALLGSAALKGRIDDKLITAKAIAAAPTNDDAVAALLQLTTRAITRGEVIRDVDACYDEVSPVIAGYERMLEMFRHKVEPSAIWAFLRSSIRLSPEYDDECLQAVDAWILRGVPIPAQPREEHLHAP